MTIMNWIKGSTLTFLPVGAGIGWAVLTENGWAGALVGILVLVLSVLSWALGAGLATTMAVDRDR